MILDCLLLVIGVALILWGADKLTDGACGLARRWQVSEMVIGLTVVAFGTSLPEFVVSLFSSLQGSANLSAGNIVGSNVFNTLVILGATALFCPIRVSTGTIWRDLPFSIMAALVLLLLGFDKWMSDSATNILSRADGLVLLLFFCIFMYYTISLGKQQQNEESDEHREIMSLWKIFVLLVVGVACLVGGGKLLVNAATNIALSLGVSETVVGLTIVAGGTSLPELATSIVAARKGSADLAIGNAIGSNLFNIFFVLGMCSSVRPMTIDGVTVLDMATLVGSGLLLWVLAFTGLKVQKGEGVLLLLVYAAYLTALVMNV